MKEKKILVLKPVAMAIKQDFKIGDTPQIVSHMLLMFITMFMTKWSYLTKIYIEQKRFLMKNSELLLWQHFFTFQ